MLVMTHLKVVRTVKLLCVQLVTELMFEGQPITQAKEIGTDGTTPAVNFTNLVALLQLLQNFNWPHSNCGAQKRSYNRRHTLCRGPILEPEA